MTGTNIIRPGDSVTFSIAAAALPWTARREMADGLTGWPTWCLYDRNGVRVAEGMTKGDAAMVVDRVNRFASRGAS